MLYGDPLLTVQLIWALVIDRFLGLVDKVTSTYIYLKFFRFRLQVIESLAALSNYGHESS